MEHIVIINHAVEWQSIINDEWLKLKEIHLLADDYSYNLGNC